LDKKKQNIGQENCRAQPREGQRTCHDIAEYCAGGLQNIGRKNVGLKDCTILDRRMAEYWTLGHGRILLRWMAEYGHWDMAEYC
jgi:hypothetical protein